MTIRNKQTTSERNIARIDIPAKKGKAGTHGWQVRFNLNRRQFSCFYSDNKHGGKEKALVAARVFRDSFVIDHEALLKRESSKRTKVTGKQDVPGVYFVKGKPKKTKPSEHCSYWRAQWPSDVPQKPNWKNFFVARYGEDEAYLLAVQARLDGMRLRHKKKNILFSIPEEKDIKIWRYLDFTKFVSMLETSSLFFTLAEDLNDPFEGSFSETNKALRSSLYEKKFFPEFVSKHHKRKEVAVSCWHMNAHESAAMWKLYSKTNEAVCVQSTYQGLRNILPELFKVAIVKYVDYDSDWIPEYHPLAAFLFKRKSFEHENELRAIVDLGDINPETLDFHGIKKTDTGIYKRVKLSKLVESIYVAPETPDWFHALVRQVATRYGLRAKVIRSSLETEPFF